MREQEDGGTVVELLLREPEIVEWLNDRRRPEPGVAGRRRFRDRVDRLPG